MFTDKNLAAFTRVFGGTAFLAFCLWLPLVGAEKFVPGGKVVYLVVLGIALVCGAIMLKRKSDTKAHGIAGILAEFGDFLLGNFGEKRFGAYSTLMRLAFCTAVVLWTLSVVICLVMFAISGLIALFGAVGTIVLTVLAVVSVCVAKSSTRKSKHQS